MPDFSTIIQAPEIRALVQENILERAFHEALFPRLLFRGEASPVIWPANVGDSMVFTGVGLIKPKMRPLAPGTDPLPSTYSTEQWNAMLAQYADTIDTHMPTSIAAIANLFLRNAAQMGLSAAQALNRIPRDRMYNAALSGWTVADGNQGGGPVSTLRVKRLNGFTRARRPDLALGSPVQFTTVSTNNPLPIHVFSGGADVVIDVTAFTPDTAGDEVGPGALTLTAHAGGAGTVTVADRAYVYSSDATGIVRVGGGYKVDDVSNSDLLRLADIRQAVSRFWQMNVPEHADGRFHCHLDPTSHAQIFSDHEFQRLLTALPDYYMYRQFAIGELLNCVFFRNSECPVPETVDGGLTASYSQDDPFAGELFNNGIAATGVKIHRPMFVGQGLLHEYYQDLGQLITEAGVTGRVGEPSITNNGIEVFSDRIQLLIRSPLNRLQDLVSTSWKFIGDWPVRTDCTTGDTARFKRVVCIEHGE
jgi:hypothetical protein